MFKNNFAVLKEINDKKKVLVISDKPRVKKAKADKPATAAVEPTPARVPVAQATKAATNTKAAKAPVHVDEPPKNSLQAHKEALKRAAAEAEAAKAAKAAAPVEEAPAAVEDEAVPVATTEGEAPADVPAAAPVEAPKLTMEEYNRLRESKRFVAGDKQLRRADPVNMAGFVELKQAELPKKPAPKKVEPVKAAPAKAAPAKGPAAKGAKPVPSSIPAAAPAPKSLPKEKKERELSLGEFLQEGRGCGGYRGRGGYSRGGRDAVQASEPKEFKLEALNFPSL